jgi:predicted small lipoprotein YifL
MIQRLTALCSALALLLALGCGNKGPLYLPQPDAPQQPGSGTEKSD